MSPTRRDAQEIARYSRGVLSSARVDVALHPVGFGNENWRLRDADGRRYLLKVADRAYEAKWRSSHTALELAGAAGLPVPELVHAGGLDDHLVRIFTWIEGHPAVQVIGDPARSRQLLRSVGEAVRVLHTLTRDDFSSRLDGSAPTFAAWEDYIDHRLRQIRTMCETTRAVDEDLVNEVCDAATGLAREVTGSAEAVVCHRDLHPDNLIVGDDGTLTGIIDWDAAEAWDRAGDWFKLEFDLLRVCPDREGDLVAGYFDGAAAPAWWAERRRLVHLVEALGVLPNAVARSWDASFADRAKAHLLTVLADAG